MKTLLVLEDEPSILAYLRHVLKHYQVLEVTTAVEALEAFAADPHKVDLLLADVNLAVSSGLQVALQLRASKPSLPVILTSGFPTNVWRACDSVDLESLGPASVVFLPKPYQASSLLKIVQELLDGTRTTGASG